MSQWSLVSFHFGMLHDLRAMILCTWSGRAHGEKLFRELGRNQGAKRRVAMRVLCCCLGLIIFAPLLFASDPSTYEDAVAAFRNQDYVAAASKFEQVVDENPSWAPGHVVLGQCYYLLGKSDRAEQSLDTARQLDPQTDLFKAAYAAAQLLLEKMQFEQAVPPLEKAVKHAPDAKAESTSFRLAYAYLMAERYEQARQSFESWQDRYGADADSSYYLALTCQRKEDYPCALVNLRKALQTGEAGDRSHKIVKYLAKWSHHWALLQQNENQRDALIRQAVKETRAWYEADPNNTVALRYYVETLLAADRSRQVVKMLLPLAQDAPEDCTVRTLLAAAFNALGEGREAQGWATQAADCDSSDAGAQIELAVSQIHQLHPQYTEVDQVRQDQRRIEAAVTALRKAVKRGANGGARAESLLADAQQTLEHLAQVEAELVERDDNHQIEIHAAILQEITERCQSIRWTKEHDPQRLSAEDEAFYAEHDCRQSTP
jgi:predicted Zn-dependent protease